MHFVSCNPVDARAIAFKLETDGCWKCVGYVVREVQEEVHSALQAKAITLVKSSSYCIGKSTDIMWVSTFLE